LETKITIAILGSNGFIGKNLCEYFKNYYNVIEINKDNYDFIKHNTYTFDYFINANGNSKRYIAQQDPIVDFEKNVNSVYNTIFDFSIKNYIYISSVEIFSDSVYGFHKKLGEQIVEKYFKNYYILRCSNILGKYLNKGIIYDIVNDKEVRLSKDSRIQMITMEEICNFINNLIENIPKERTYTLAGINSLSVEEISNKMNKNIKYHKETRKEFHQFYINNSNYFFKTSEEYLNDYKKDLNL
jgi:dTDP-4-dehydrorhamnose reductase